MNAAPASPSPSPAGPNQATPATSAVQVIVQPRHGQPALLVPDETANFDIILRNDGTTPFTGKAIEGNLDTPIVRLFGPGGMIGQFDMRTVGSRMIGDFATVIQPDPPQVTLAPGAQQATWVNLWGFHEPLPPGTYSVEVAHRPGGATPPITSPRVSFEIVAATVHAVAFGYDSRNRGQTELAWLALPAGAGRARLLVRESGFAGHASLHQGGNLFGEFSPQARVAVSQWAWDAKSSAMQWVAAVEPDGHGHAYLHASAFLQGSPVAFDLGLREPVLAKRFPNRNHAVVLGVGIGPKGPALAGVVIPQGGQPPRSWSVPLQEPAQNILCAYLHEGPIQVLLWSDDGHKSRVRLIEISETGQVLRPEHVLRETPNHIVAATVGQRSLQAFFVLLETDRANPDRGALLRFAATGDRPPQTVDLGRIKGWPTVQHPDGSSSGTPEAATAAHLEQALDGGVHLALTNARGDLLCGKVDDHLSLTREAKGAPIGWPHMAITQQDTGCFGFEPSGRMFTTGGHFH